MRNASIVLFTLLLYWSLPTSNAAAADRIVIGNVSRTVEQLSPEGPDDTEVLRVGENGIQDDQEEGREVFWPVHMDQGRVKSLPGSVDS